MWANPHSTSTAKLNGVTSNNKISVTFPWIIPHWIAAHCATASSGFTVAFGAFPKAFWTIPGIWGILVDPQTRIISFISLVDNPLSFIATDTGPSHFLNNSEHNDSNFALVSTTSKFFGDQSGHWAMNGIVTSTLSTFESCILAFSASSSLKCWSNAKS